MDYRNFDLRIEPGTPYRIIVESDLGEVAGTLELDVTQPAFRDGIARLAERQTDQTFLEQFGQLLFDSLFHNAVAAIFERSSGYVLAEHKGLRIRLRITPPEMAVVPWELLYEPSRDFLATSEQTPIVRWLAVKLPIQDLAASPPLRLMVAIPQILPPFPPLEVDAEIDALKKAASKFSPDVEMTVLRDKVSLQDIDHALIESGCHVFHFIGHARFGTEGGELLLNDEGGGMVPVGEAEFARLFVDRPDTKLVVLNACEGAQSSPHHPFLGIAPQLVRRGIPAVVAMQYGILDRAAISFAREFYFALFHGANAGRIDWAISHARNVLARDFPDDREQATPVLYLRAPEGVLFYLDTRNRLRDAAISRAAVDSELAAVAAHHFNQGLADDPEARTRPGLDSALAADLTQYQRLKSRIAFRNRLVLAAAGALVLLLSLSWVKLFDLLYLDTLVEGLTYVGADVVAAQPPLREDILIVTTDEAISWRDRARHARMLDRLSAAGARAVVFDLYMPPHGEIGDAGDERRYREVTDAFAAAVRDAERRGTAVVLGYEDVDAGSPVMAPAIGAAMAPGRLGHLCMSGVWGYVTKLPLVIEAADGALHPSLALAAYAAARGGDATELAMSQEDWRNRVMHLPNRALGRIAFSEHRVSSSTACSANPPGSDAADLFLDFSPLDTIRAPRRRLSYQEVLSMDAGDLARRAESAILFVGTATDRVNLFDPGQWQRYGVELHADAYNAIGAIAQGARPIRMAGFGMQALIMGAIVALGAGVRFWVPRSRTIWRRAALAVMVVGYGAIVLQLFTTIGILLDSVYHLVALGLSFWLAGRIERRWIAQWEGMRRVRS